MKKTFALLFVCLFAPGTASSQTSDIYARPERYERSRDYNPLHYKLKYSFDMEAKTYWGENTITLSSFKDGLRAIVLDAEDFKVTAVVGADGAPLKFEQPAGQLIVEWPGGLNHLDKAVFTVKYTATNPKTGMKFVDAAPTHPAQVNTYSWPENAHHWYPCFDYPNSKITNEMIVTVKGDDKVLSNGRLVGVAEDAASGTRTYHWSQEQPHPSYNIMMAVGPFEVVKDSLGELPVDYWVYKKDGPDAMRSFRKTPKMIDFFNTTFGFKYPWAKYDQVCYAGYGGGMEATSATMLGHDTIHNERADQDFSSEGLVAHELAHQWWGDAITERSWTDVWLSESFATYSEYLFSRFDKGEDEGAVNLLDKKNAYLREAKTRYIRPLVFNRYNQPWDVMDSHSYPKGATVLHLLRFIMGDKPFFRSLAHFLNKFAFQAVDTHDLMIAIREATGQNMDWFFEQWVYKPGHPAFDVSYNWDPVGKKIKMKVVQVQDTAKGVPIYKAPVVIGITTAKGKTAEKVWFEKKEENYEFNADEKPLLVRFDEGNFLIKEVTFPKSAEELLFQLKNDDVIGRMSAATELLKYKDDPAVATALAERVKGDSFWAVRRSAVESLASLRRPRDAAFFQGLSADPSSKVRAAAIIALGNTSDPKLVKYFKDRFNNDSSYVVQAESLVAIGKRGSKADADFLKKAGRTASPRNRLKTSAENALKAIKERASK